MERNKIVFSTFLRTGICSKSINRTQFLPESFFNLSVKLWNKISLILFLSSNGAFVFSSAILNSNDQKENHEIISEYYEKKGVKTKDTRPVMCFDNVNNNISQDEIKMFKKHLLSFYVPKYIDTLNFLEKKNIMTIVIIQPSYNDIRQKIQSDILREISKKFQAVHLLDLSDKIDILDIKISYDKMHNTKLGNQITADFIYKKIFTLLKNNIT